MDDFIFLNKKETPSEENLLGQTPRAYEIIQGIKDHLSSQKISFTEEWKFYSSKSGWTMKMLSGKRNLLFCTPLKSGARVSFIFGDKAVEEVNKSSIPQNIKDDLNNAKKYAEGRGVAIQARTKKDLKAITRLLDIKYSVK